jgi:4-hydroxybenzoate polyprenyltransferase
MATARLLFRSLRPQQWIKNGFILIPLIFAQRVFHGPSVFLSLQALFIFCILSSAIYLINDINDLEADRRHPEKRHRPLAAGLISTTLAKVTAVLLLTVSLLWGAHVGRVFLFVLAIYLTVQLLYNYRLKEIVILDIFCVSSGFFLRVTSGAVAIDVSISHWLIICTVLISIFLALAKRRHELVLLGNTEAGNHRKALSSYSPLLLDQMMGVITASTLLSYMLYCVSPETIEKFQTDHLIYTFPFVLYGIFRYLYLIHIKAQGGAPEKILVSDLPMAVSIILWGLFCMLIIYGVI